MDFGGCPLISHVVSAASAADGIRGSVVVTSDHPSDNELVEWCHSHGVQVWRGDLNDVADRLLGAAAYYGTSSFVRVSGDSPMLDPQIISFAVRRFGMSSPDLVTNVRPRTFPPGQSVEVIRTRTLERLLASADSHPGDQEHVTPILYRHESEIEVDRFAPSDMQSGTSTLNGPYKSMAVDTPEDAECFRRVIRDAGSTQVWMRGWEQCEAMMRDAHQRLHGGPGAWHA